MDEKIRKLIQHKAVIPTVVGVTAFAGGAIVGYIFGVKRTKDSQTNDVATQEQLELPLFDTSSDFIFEQSQDTISFSIPLSSVNSVDANEEEVVEENLSIVIFDEDKPEEQEEELVHPVVEPEKNDPRTIVVEDQPNIPVKKSIFENSAIEDDWNYEVEVQSRRDRSVYIIHRDEFYGEESGYPQTTLTYYAGDNILTDENDVPIYNFPAIVGDLKFGYGSNDRNVVYVRNDKLKAEYEILLSSGSYEEEILGYQVERTLESKSKKNSVPRFREE